MGQAALMEEPDYFHTEMPVGQILQRARLHYKQSIPDIERALRIRGSLIEAIEENRLDDLPGRAYALGFVRSYAEYLGLDANRIINLFKEQSVGVKEKPELHFPVAASESKMPALWLVAVSLIMAVIVIVFWVSYTEVDRAEVTEIPSVPVEMKERVETAMPFGPPRPQVEAVEETPEAGIILNITENSWVEIRDTGGRVMVSKVLKAGDQYFVPDSPDLRMSLGNAGGVEIFLDGRALAPLGRPGSIIRDVPLGREALQSLQNGIE